MSYAQKFNLNPADRIVAPLFQFSITKHHAIYLGVDDYGQELIAENDFNQGVRIVSAERFFSENPTLVRIERFQGNYFQRNIALQTAIELEGKPYDLFLYNCEHYANEVQHGRVKSNQVENLLIALGVSAFVYVLVNR
jgi:hypothetical protein